MFDLYPDKTIRYANLSSNIESHFGIMYLRNKHGTYIDKQVVSLQYDRMDVLA